MIDLQQLHLHYPSRQGPVHALRGVDLHVAAGEIYGVIGRSGAGKSSLVRTINLLHRPTEGRVVVDGVELTALPPARLREVRRGLGMVFQHFNLLASRTVYDNIALPLELAGEDAASIRRRVQPLLELVGLAGLAHRYPAQISGGQKQRVGIARALANQPKVLLCDEATSALDPETTRSILALLQDINRSLGLTIVLITHQMQVIKQVAQRLAVMEAGQVVEEGRTLEVFAQPRHPATRSLLDEVVPQGLPASILARARALLQAPGAGAGQLWQLAFQGDSAAQPLLSALAQRFGLDLHLLHGQIDEVQGELFGHLAVLSRGPQAQLAAAVQQLQAGGIRVQEVGHA